MKLLNVFFITLFVLIIGVFTANAEIPEKVSFQGFLTDSNGYAVEDSNYTLTFSLWDGKSEANDNKLWEETQVVPVQRGIYSVDLGSSESFPNTMTFAIPLYLGVQVNGGDILKINGNLLNLTSTWTAFRSKTSSGKLVTSVAEDYTIENSDDIILANGNIAIKLPSASVNKGKIITVKNIGSLSVSLTTVQGQTIEGEASQTLEMENEAQTFFSDGQNWVKLSNMPAASEMTTSLLISDSANSNALVISSTGKAVVVGQSANGFSTGTAMGYQTDAYNYGAAMGYQANGFRYGTAMGYQANGFNYGTAIGISARAMNQGAAIGNSANGYDYGASVGRKANGAYYGASIGYYSNGSSSGSAIGQYANGSSNGAGVGRNANGYTNGVGVGRNANGAYYGSALGQYANGITNGAAMGRNSNGSNNGAAVGNSANAVSSGTAVGYAANGSNNAIAIGVSANANHTITSTSAAPKIAIGYETNNDQAGNTVVMRGKLYLDGAGSSPIYYRENFGTGNYVSYTELSAGGGSEVTVYTTSLTISDSSNANNLVITSTGSGVMIGSSAKGYTDGAAVGYFSNGSDSGVAFGYGANGFHLGTSVGYYANGYNYGVSLGKESKGINYGTSLGTFTNASEFGAAVGIRSNGNFYGVAMGDSSNGYKYGTAVGRNANGYSFGTSLGMDSNANHITESTSVAPKIAIGYDTDNDQAGNTCVIRGNLYLNYSDGNIRWRADNSSAFNTKAFVIDHPLDPENKILRHATLESPSVLNVYVGVTELDEDGEAVVKLPDYFDPLNINPKYQLTAVGQAMPNLHIKEKVHNNTFVIAGGAPYGEVSWEIKGERNDKAMQDHPFVVEEDKLIPGLIY